MKKFLVFALSAMMCTINAASTTAADDAASTLQQWWKEHGKDAQRAAFPHPDFAQFERVASRSALAAVAYLLAPTTGASHDGPRVMRVCQIHRNKEALWAQLYPQEYFLVRYPMGAVLSRWKRADLEVKRLVYDVVAAEICLHDKSLRKRKKKEYGSVVNFSQRYYGSCNEATRRLVWEAMDLLGQPIHMLYNAPHSGVFKLKWNKLSNAAKRAFSNWFNSMLHVQEYIDRCEGRRCLVMLDNFIPPTNRCYNSGLAQSAAKESVLGRYCFPC